MDRLVSNAPNVIKILFMIEKDFDYRTNTSLLLFSDSFFHSLFSTFFKLSHRAVLLNEKTMRPYQYADRLFTFTNRTFTSSVSFYNYTVLLMPR